MIRRLAGAAAAAAAGYALLVEPRRLVVRHHRLALPHWPAELDGFRVGVLSDFHAARRTPAPGRWRSGSSG